MNDLWGRRAQGPFAKDGGGTNQEIAAGGERESQSDFFPGGKIIHLDLKILKSSKKSPKNIIKYVLTKSHVISRTGFVRGGGAPIC